MEWLRVRESRTTSSSRIVVARTIVPLNFPFHRGEMKTSSTVFVYLLTVEWRDVKWLRNEADTATPPECDESLSK